MLSYAFIIPDFYIFLLILYVIILIFLLVVKLEGKNDTRTKIYLSTSALGVFLIILCSYNYAMGLNNKELLSLEKERISLEKKNIAIKKQQARNLLKMKVEFSIKFRDLREDEELYKNADFSKFVREMLYISKEALDDIQQINDLATIKITPEMSNFAIEQYILTSLDILIARKETEIGEKIDLAEVSLDIPQESLLRMKERGASLL